MSMNQAYILYRDTKGYELEMQSGDVWLSTMHADLRYYWGNAKQASGWFGSFGFHPGLRTGYGQFGADVGISASVMHAFQLSANASTGRRLIIGGASDIMRNGLLNRSNNVDLTTRPSIMSGEINVSIEGKQRAKHRLAGGMVYRCSQSLQNTDNMTGQVLSAPFTSYHWHHAGTHLFETSHSWTAWLGYQRKAYSVSMYVQEDFPISNAPDLQTGIEFIYQLQSAKATN